MSLALLLTLVAAEAAPARVAIVPIVGAQERADITNVVEVVGDEVAKHLKVEPTEVDELYGSDVDVLSEVPRCGGNANCVRGALTRFGADVGLVVVLNRRIDPPIVQIELVPGRDPKQRVGTAPTSVGAGETEEAVLRRLTLEVLEKSGYTVAAQISVKPEPADATVTLDSDKKDRRGPQIFKVGPGAHRVDVTRVGYRPFEQTKTLASGERWDLVATLEAEPEDGSLWSSPVLWGVVAAVVVAGAVVGTVAATSSGTDQVCIFSKVDCG